MRDLPEPNRRRLIIGAIVIAAAIVGLYFLIPKLAGLNQTWGQLTHGNPWLIVLGGILELLSVAGYTVLFHTVFARGIERITWCVTIQITLAGIAAIRLLSGAGVGGVAVSAWALSRAGMPSTVIAYWGFDIAVLGLSFKAFNQEMSVAVLVMGYLVGTFGSLLPLPGGVGGIEAGMIGSFAASGSQVGRAVVGVLACRAISFWLPTIPGIVGYFRLRSAVHDWRQADREAARA